MAEGVLQQDVLVVVETEGLYLLRIDYEETDPGSAIGHVFWADGLERPGQMLTQVLATNDTLRTMWAAPSATLWVASADGSVGTTAVVDWPLPTSGADYLTLGPSPKWSATDLPRETGTGLRPNVTALWGTGDSDVYAGSFNGYIYRWNGTVWAQVFEGPGGGAGTIAAFGGAVNDVYAVGKDGLLVHFDGQVWRRLDVPGPPNGRESLTGVLRNPTGEILISASGDQGRLLFGSALGGISEFGRYTMPFIAMAALGDRVFFAIGDGAAELIGRDVTVVKSNFKSANAFSGKERLFFIEATQTSPTYIRFDPRKPDALWARISN